MKFACCAALFLTVPYMKLNAEKMIVFGKQTRFLQHESYRFRSGLLLSSEKGKTVAILDI